MPRYEVETTTGSIYDIDTDAGVWSKNGDYEDRIIQMSEGEWDGTFENIPAFQRWPDVDKPQVGKNLFIRGRGMHNWYLTTPVVRVTEVS